MDAQATESQARVRRLYEAFGRADIDAIRREVSEDAIISFSGASDQVPWHVGARGVAQLPEFFRLLEQHLAFERFEVQSEIASPAHVARLVHVRYRVKSTGRIVDQRQVHWLTLAEGRVTSLTHFEDSAQVVGAVVLGAAASVPGPTAQGVEAAVSSAGVGR